MFGCLHDAFNYPDRVVGRFERPGLLISTARVSDSTRPFETYVRRGRVLSGDFAVVEEYDNAGDAAVGHELWVMLLTHDPNRALVDRGTSQVKQLLNALREKGVDV